jgi:uncharacterized protein (TIGR02996 family)
MTERDALLRAVCENPDDDTPRLVYADWLQENGDEARAEFIRLQVAIAAMSDGKAKQKKQAREKQLLDAHKEQWAEPLKPYFAYYYAGIYAHHYAPPVVFRRGFVESIAMDVETFRARGGEVFALAPVRELRVQDAQSLDDLAESKHLLRLHTLNLGGAVLSEQGSGASVLLRSKYLANLTALVAGGQDDNGHLDPAGLRAIAGSRHLAKLEHLNVGGNWMFGQHADRRRAAAYRKVLWSLGEKMPVLRELRLSNIGLEDGEVLGLLQQRWVRQLRVLDLSRNSLGPEGCKALCDSKALAKLERLILTGNQYFDESSADYVALPAAAKRMLRQRFGKRVVL